jgi:nitrate/nitrite transport system ATP-binding protein
MPIVQLENVAKSYPATGGGRTQVLQDVNLAVAEGEFLAVLGFSGAGKSTLISLIAGLVSPDSGQVLIRGKPIRGAGPDRGVVFQNYSLMPWLTVKANVGLAVDATMKKASAAEREARAREAIAMVGLSHAIDRRPSELSGGMRQRVAVARALAMDPAVLLLDEPLSALDALTRAKLQDEIEWIWRQQRKTVILITNDVDEAILLADRIVPLTPGPGATLGQEFKVDLPRPRERTAVNHDPQFKQLRNEITRYLMALGIESRAAVAEGPQLPTVTPMPPPALRRAQKPATAQDLNRFLDFSKLSKTYPTPKGPLTVVEEFDLKVRRGEFISLIGHSGCGKSTVLSMAAGLNDISTGGIILDGVHVTMAGPDKGVVFQAPSLFPWLTAYENVALGVERVYPHAAPTERDDIIRYYLTRVGLADAMEKKAADLSNGMKQRVGIARAFALSPKLLLLDEPFGMLDSLTRWELQEVLMEVWGRTHVTAICVTHDVDEAIMLADRVIMMTNGPNARIGNIMEVTLPRPRSRKSLLEHPDYYRYREELLAFLEEHEKGLGPKGGTASARKAA